MDVLNNMSEQAVKARDEFNQGFKVATSRRRRRATQENVRKDGHVPNSSESEKSTSTVERGIFRYFTRRVVFI